MKRTGDNENCWLDIPEPRSLYTDRSGTCVRDGDEVITGEWGQNQTCNFQICQSCQEAFPLDRISSVCPHCGFDLDSAIEAQAEISMILQSHETHRQVMNELMSYILNIQQI